MLLSNSSLHFVIIDRLLNKGFCPDTDQLARHFDVSTEKVNLALRQLEGDHGCLLNKDKNRIIAIHPFSLIPSDYRVESNGQQWWANCAWCALGVVHLAGGTATITARLYESVKEVVIRLENGIVIDSDYLIHFPVPMEEAWNDVAFTCSTMRFFTSTTEVQLWCEQTKIPLGDLQNIRVVSSFARQWYGCHRDPDWKKWTREEALQMFKDFGFTHPIWQIPVSAESF